MEGFFDYLQGPSKRLEFDNESSMGARSELDDSSVMRVISLY